MTEIVPIEIDTRGKGHFYKEQIVRTVNANLLLVSGLCESNADSENMYSQVTIWVDPGWMFIGAGTQRSTYRFPLIIGSAELEAGSTEKWMFKIGSGAGKTRDPVLATVEFHFNFPKKN